MNTKLILSAIIGAMIAGISFNLYFAQTTVSNDELELAGERAAAEREKIRAELAFVRSRQDEVRETIAAHEARLVALELAVQELQEDVEALRDRAPRGGVAGVGPRRYTPRVLRSSSWRDEDHDGARRSSGRRPQCGAAGVRPSCAVRSDPLPSAPL